MAQIVTITNPITGQPAQVDQLDHTAQQIDDAIARAAAGGAIDTDLALKAPLASPALTGTPTINGVPVATLESPAFTGTPTINGVAAANVGQLCNPNLLDNAYFVNPVDQRGGYVVPPNTPYNDSSGQVGTTTTYYTVTGKQSDDWYKFKINGTEYFCYKDYVVRGYTGNGYGIDRWKLLNDTSTLLITNEGVKLIYDNSGWHLSQFLQGVLRKGITYTYSVLYKASGNNIRLVCTWGNNKYFYNYSAPTTDTWSLATVTGTIPEDAVIDYEQIVIQSLDSGAGTIDIKAAKLELGSQQTLAHLENGVWVLNEIPDYGEQLARCQRYQIVISSKDQPASVGIGIARSATEIILVIPLPTTLRIKPTCTLEGEIALRNGASFFYATAITSTDMVGPGEVKIKCVASGLTAGTVYEAYLSNSTVDKITIDANL